MQSPSENQSETQGKGAGIQVGSKIGGGIWYSVGIQTFISNSDN